VPKVIKLTYSKSNGLLIHLLLKTEPVNFYSFIMNALIYKYIFEYFLIIFMLWRKFNGEKIMLPIKEAVRQAIIAESEKKTKLKVCIGTDSQVKANMTEFATVIVFLREHNGGFMYIHNDKTTQKYHLKERMLTEVAKSIEIAYELCDLFIEHHVEMEVHADINTNPQFKSNDALKEAMGYILGMGFAFKAKPEAFASSCCADKAVN